MIIKILSCTLRNQTHIIILMFIPIYNKSIKKWKEGRKVRTVFAVSDSAISFTNRLRYTIFAVFALTHLTEARDK